jgi:hypothetical protein
MSGAMGCQLETPAEGESEANCCTLKSCPAVIMAKTTSFIMPITPCLARALMKSDSPNVGYRTLAREMRCSAVE